MPIRILQDHEAIAREVRRFLDLPFYQTGKVKKDPITERDVEIVLAVLEEVRPYLVFAAGDLSDPHGTHRMCFEAMTQALDAYAGPAPQLWLYRGVCQEWSLTEADVLVPMSFEGLRRKTLAVFKRQSQKEVAPFPGSDPRVSAAGRGAQPWDGRAPAHAGVAGLLRDGSLRGARGRPAPGRAEGAQRLALRGGLVRAREVVA